jgi:hypothetical protein
MEGSLVYSSRAWRGPGYQWVASISVGAHPEYCFFTKSAGYCAVAEMVTKGLMNTDMASHAREKIENDWNLPESFNDNSGANTEFTIVNQDQGPVM